MSSKNYFESEEAAGLYRKARISFHQEALIRHLHQRPTRLFRKALDVGCGTGLSSIALAAWSDFVVAIDSSPFMLKEAILNEKISYQLGKAEELGFGQNEFDVLFLASSFHWLERKKFFAGVKRILEPTGRIFLYDAFLVGGLTPAFSQNFKAEFPSVFEMKLLTPEELNEYGFRFEAPTVFEIDTALTREEIIGYFMSLSNVIARIPALGVEGTRQLLTQMVSDHSDGGPFRFRVMLSELRKNEK